MQSKKQKSQEEKMKLALECYFKRQSREEHPSGYFDNKKRWDPDASEKRNCCFSIRQPSAAYPFSLMTHCRSVSHIANLFDVNASELRSAIAQWHLLKREAETESAVK